MEHCSDEELNTTIMVQIREVWNLNVISDTCAFRMCADTSLNINNSFQILLAFNIHDENHHVHQVILITHPVMQSTFKIKGMWLKQHFHASPAQVVKRYPGKCRTQ